MRAAVSTRTVSALAVLGLVAVSVLLVLIVNTASVVNPSLPVSGGNPSRSPTSGGILFVQVISNQNQTDKISDPLDRWYALGGLSVTVSQENGSGAVQEYVMTTDRDGQALQYIPGGSYVVQIQDETVDAQIPVQVSVGNETKLEVSFNGAEYPLLYSEDTGLVPTAGGPQSSMYVEVGSAATVAIANEPVVLRVAEGGRGAEYSVNATVVSQEPPSGGTQWLVLGTGVPVDPAGATSISLLTWTYSTFIPPQIPFKDAGLQSVPFVDN